MIKKLDIAHLEALSYGLMELSTMPAYTAIFTELHALICIEVKVKVDKKLAGHFFPKNGSTIKLSPAQLCVIKLINERNVFGNSIVFRNALTRLLMMNKFT